jgi:hypothetical protein
MADTDKMWLSALTIPAGATWGAKLPIRGKVPPNFVNVAAWDSVGTKVGADVKPLADHSFRMTIDTAKMAMGTDTVIVAAFTVPAGQPGGQSQSASLKLSTTAAQSTPAPAQSTSAPSQSTPTPTPAPTSDGPAAGMKLVFEETFDKPLDTANRWWVGPKPDGGQWSGAHFVRPDEPEFSKVYVVKDGQLSIRAFHDDNYRDPDGWGRKWYSGQMSSCFPGGKVTGGAQNGYFEARMKVPFSNGAWPGFWFLAGYTGFPQASDPGGIEIDFEFYGDARDVISTGIHDWPGNTGQDAEAAKFDQGVDFSRPGPDYTKDFHTFGMLLTPTEVVMYADRVEFKRYRRPSRSPTTPFFALLDLAIQENHGVDIPAAGGYVELLVDYVRIWQAP